MTNPVRPVPPPSRLVREPGGCAFGAVMLMAAPMIAAGVCVAKWLGV